MKASDINPEYLKKHGIEVPRNKASKYGNRRTEYAGVTYASGLEALVAAQLDFMQRTTGEVVRWERQVPFDLGSGIRYVADFVVHYATGAPRTIDAKGMLTPEFKLKRKLFEEKYGPLDIVKKWQETPTEGR